MAGLKSGYPWSPIGTQVAPTTDAASRVWTVDEVADYEGLDSWPVPPGPVSLISSNYPSSDVASITIGSIPQNFQAIELWLHGVATNTNNNQFRLQMNSGGSATHSLHGQYYAQSSSWGNSLLISPGTTDRWDIAWNSTVQADPSMPIPVRVLIPGYSLSRPKVMHGSAWLGNYTQYDYANIRGDIFVGHYTGGAITSMTWTVNSGSIDGGAYSKHPIGYSLFGWGT